MPWAIFATPTVTNLMELGPEFLDGAACAMLVPARRPGRRFRSMAITAQWLKHVDKSLDTALQSQNACLRRLMPLRPRPSSATQAELLKALNDLDDAVSMLWQAVLDFRHAHNEELQGTRP
jgi:hypothetical protein